MKKRLVFILLSLFTGLSFAQLQDNDLFRAMEAFNNGNYVSAYALLSDIEKRDGVHENILASAMFYKAECQYNLMNLDGASGLYSEFIEKFRKSEFREKAFLQLGICYFELENYRKCRTVLQKMISEYSEGEFTGSGKYWIGEAYYREDMFFEAEEHLLESISLANSNQYRDHAIFTAGSVYEKIEDYTSAATYYDELLAFYRDSKLAPVAQQRIGICYFKLKDYDSAVLELTDPLIQKLPLAKQTETRYILANSFFRLKDYENAAKVYNEILRLDPGNNDNHEVWYGLAWVKFQLRDYKKAYEIFKFLSEAPNDSIAANSLYWSAEAKRYDGEVNNAFAIYNRFLAKYGNHKLSPLVRFKIGVLYYNDGRVDEAEQYLISSLSSEDISSKGKALTLLGEISLNNKDHRSAENYFVTALAEYDLPDDVIYRALLGLGVTYYLSEEYNLAIEKFTELLSKSKTFEKDKVNFYLAESYFENKDFTFAVKHFTRVNYENEKLGASALYGRAYSLFNLKDYADAAYYFAEFISKYRFDDRYIDAKQRLADSYYGTKNFERASEIYTEVYKENRFKLNDDFSYYQYGQSMFKAGNSKRAIAIFEELVSRYPTSNYVDDSKYLIGWINFQDADYINALKTYRELLEQHPNSSLKPIVFYSIGDTYYNQEQYDSANVYYMKILEQYPSTRYVFDAINGMQYSFMAINKPEKAVEVIDKFIVSYPTSIYGDDILYKKGDIYFSIGEYSKAQVGYKELIATYPESEFVPNAYYWIGKSAQNLDNTENAIFNFRHVVNNYIFAEIGVSSAIELIKIYEQNSEWESTIALIDTVLEQIPDSKKQPELMFYKANALIKTDNLQAGYETYNNIITYYTENLFADKAKFELGYLEMKRKGYRNAELMFGELGSKRNDDIGAMAQYYYGVTLLEQEKVNDAITAFVRVRSVFGMYDEWYTKSLLKLGECFTITGQKKQARDMFRAVIKRHPNDELGKEAKRKMRKL